ncbi:MAG: ACP S-malonyltransferase [Phycisphaerae bacterium]|nr:ACP S-malonyltransferase [Phycisphaerae bacterium]
MNPARIILCPGQGAQAVGMAKAWCDRSPEARRVFDEADRVLAGRLPGGARLSDLCFGGPAEALNRTDVSQPAIYTASVACWHALMAGWQAGSLEETRAVAGAGLSLGEYTALHIAGCFSFADGLNLVALRGAAMQAAAEAAPSGMVALIGADEAQATQVCTEALAAAGPGQVLVCANFNAPGQIVISGSKAACDAAAAPDGPAAKLGLRATALTVAGAFHSPLMAPAAEKLRAALEATAIAAPRIEVISNVTARAHAPEAGRGIEQTIRQRLVEQLTAPVRWAQSAAALAQAHAGAEFIELAPGKTLMGLMRRIDKSVKVHTHDEPV